jgi:ribosomal protein L12E/L44/L45/RPP1/RPP2
LVAALKGKTLSDVIAEGLKKVGTLSLGGIQM